jgi:putative FmdB family regulatory protein
MPLYDYKCSEHGLFHDLVPMQASGECAPCPTCGALSARVIMVAPEVLDMAPERRQAFERNEKAVHEPRQGNERSATRCSRRHGPG